jgi:hypothetical protein
MLHFGYRSRSPSFTSNPPYWPVAFGSACLPLLVSACSTSSLDPCPSSFTLFDIPSHPSCLATKSVSSNRRHLFFTSRDRPRKLLASLGHPSDLSMPGKTWRAYLGRPSSKPRTVQWFSPAVVCDVEPPLPKVSGISQRTRN